MATHGPGAWWRDGRDAQLRAKTSPWWWVFWWEIIGKIGEITSNDGNSWGWIGEINTMFGPIILALEKGRKCSWTPQWFGQRWWTHEFYIPQSSSLTVIWRYSKVTAVWIVQHSQKPSQKCPCQTSDICTYIYILYKHMHYIPIIIIIYNTIYTDPQGVALFVPIWHYVPIRVALLSTEIQGIWLCTFAVMVTTPFVTTRRNAGNVEGRPPPGQGDRWRLLFFHQIWLRSSKFHTYCQDEMKKMNVSHEWFALS